MDPEHGTDAGSPAVPVDVRPEDVPARLDGAGTPDGFRRLWAPHRMAYIAGETGTGESDDDVTTK